VRRPPADRARARPGAGRDIQPAGQADPGAGEGDAGSARQSGPGPNVSEEVALEQLRDRKNRDAQTGEERGLFALLDEPLKPLPDVPTIVKFRPR
jgi:hypothetical protein